MNEVKIRMSDDSVHTIQGEVQKVTVKELGVEQEWTLKTVNINGEIEIYEVDGVIIRPNRPPR